MNEHELAKLLRDNPDLRTANTKAQHTLAVIKAHTYTADEMRQRILPVNGKAIHFTLPWPPSLNKLYARGYRGKVRLSTTATAWKSAARLAMQQANITEPVEGAIEVTLTQYRPRKTGDIDNYQKLLLDTIQGYAYVNDNQITTLHVHRNDDKKNPRVEVTITRKETK